jgi:uncharacterized membrane protein
MVIAPTLKDPAMRTLMEQILMLALMLALSTHKESMNRSTMVVFLTPMMVQVVLYWLGMNLQKSQEGEGKEI